jgi:superfamily II DNA or RNA helicase
VLFSDQRDHLETLYGYLLALGVKPSDIAFYVGGIKKAEKEAAKSKRLLLATYNFMGEGTDVPSLDAAILSTPRSDVRQIVGRVIRSLDGKQTPVVFDLIDDDSPVFEAYSNKRMKFYNSVGAKVTDVS